MMPLSAYPAKEMCKIIDGFPTGASKISRVFVAASLYYNCSRGGKCFQLEIESNAHGLHVWNGKSCTEMVMPMTYSKESMFLPSSLITKRLNKDARKNMGSGLNRIGLPPNLRAKELKRYGGNITSSNGMQDPWSRGGILKNISSSIISLVTEERAHHIDFRSATKDDPRWLKELRRQDVEIIQRWINECYKDR